MAVPIALGGDFDGSGLRRLAKQSKDAAQARRLLALAEIYDGGSRTDAARIGGVTLQIVRDWVLRFNKHGPAGLINGKAPGNRPKLNEKQRQALARMVESGPIPAIHGVVRWRRKDLARWLFEEFRIEVDETTVGRALRALGFAKLSARPRHYAQNEREREALKKACPPNGRRSRRVCRTAPRSSCGGMTRPGSGRRTRGPGAGRDAAHGPQRRTTSARPGPPSSGPSARRRARAPVPSCPPATQRPWRPRWRRSATLWRRERTRCCCWTKPAGMSRPS